MIIWDDDKLLLSTVPPTIPSFGVEIRGQEVLVMNRICQIMRVS